MSRKTKNRRLERMRKRREKARCKTFKRERIRRSYKQSQWKKRVELAAKTTRKRIVKDAKRLKARKEAS